MRVEYVQKESFHLWVRSCGIAGLLMDGRTGSIIFGHGLTFTLFFSTLAVLGP